jgi:uncharacterized protein YjbI with pentapeptide repeats
MAMFAGADCTAAIFTGARLDRSNWAHAQCQQAVFDRASLTWADLSHADLAAARFVGANLEGANLHAIADLGTDWSGASLRKARRTDRALLKAESWTRPPR